MVQTLSYVEYAQLNCTYVRQKFLKQTGRFHLIKMHSYLSSFLKSLFSSLFLSPQTDLEIESKISQLTCMYVTQLPLYLCQCPRFGDVLGVFTIEGHGKGTQELLILFLKLWTIIQEYLTTKSCKDHYLLKKKKSHQLTFISTFPQNCSVWGPQGQGLTSSLVLPSEILAF